MNGTFRTLTAGLLGIAAVALAAACSSNEGSGGGGDDDGSGGSAATGGSIGEALSLNASTIGGIVYHRS